jgi:uncharacterized protein YutE (UPF0331/DUF86 family)
MVNKEKIQNKLDFIKNNLEKLNIMRRYNKEEFFSDFEHIYASEHLIQTTIQALTDTAGFIIASKKFRSPKNSVDMIEILYENKLLDVEQRDLFQKIIRFRNIVVYLYNGVNEKMVFDLLQNNLKDLEEFFTILIVVITGK